MKTLRNILKLHFQQLIICAVSHAILTIPENIKVVWYMAELVLYCSTEVNSTTEAVNPS